MVEPITCASCIHKSQELSANSVKDRSQQQQYISPTASPLNFLAIPRLNYLHSHQHNNLNDPFTLGSPLFAATTVASPAAGGTTPPALGSNGSPAQFVLTPDARACVTAAYLCLLLVNNTWIDCNRLEMLCTNEDSSATTSPSPDDEKRRAREEHIAAVAETTMQLRAFETALEELITYAGGANHGAHGAPNTGNEKGVLLDMDGSNQQVSTQKMISTADFATESSRKPDAEFLEDKGGGGSRSHLYVAEELLSQLLLHNGRGMLTRNELTGLSPQPAPDELSTGAGERLRIKEYENASDVENEAAEQYLSILVPSKISNHHNQVFNPNQIDTIQPSAESTVKTLDQQQQSDFSSTTQVPLTSTTTPPSSSLTGWMVRPFRGWSSYSFWSNSGGGQPDSIGSRQKEPQRRHPPQHQQIKILRPIDRSEPYNDILTNQLSLKHNISWPANQRAPVIDQQQYQHRNPINDQRQQYQSIGNSIDRYQQQQQQHQLLFQQQKPDQSSLQHQHQKLLNVRQQQQAANNQFDLINSSADQSEPTAGHPPALLEQPLRPHRVVASSSVADSQQASPAVELANVYEFNESEQQQQMLSLKHRQQQQQQHGDEHPDSAIQLSGAQSLDQSATFSPPPITTLGPSPKMSPLDVTFLLYTRANQHDLSTGQPLSLEQLTTTSFPANETQADAVGGGLSGESTLGGLAGFNGSLPIKIIIHGFGSGKRVWVSEMVLKLLEHEDVNVIVVDWEKGAALPNYVQAAGNTRLVGHKIATLIKAINAKFGLTGNSYHLIGFSLGAHVAGFAGMEIRNSTSSSRFWINRITGLDPASPLFEGYEANDRLDPSDAQFVDVIHSNGDGVLRGGFGSLQPMGQVDFYPNGGRVQTGCVNSVLLSALSDIIYGKWQSLCSHRRALNFFMNSFESANNNCRFRAFNCDSYESYLKGECFDCGANNEKCSYMGYMANQSNGRGKMYLTTHEDGCANQYTIKIIGTKGFKSNWGKVEATLISSDGKNESYWLSSASQQSSGHEMIGSGGAGGGGTKDLSSLQQHYMQSLIAAHKPIAHYTHVQLLYSKYKGWIYSGDENLHIDKVLLVDQDGQTKSFCGFNTVLESAVSSRIQLELGNCTVHPESNQESVSQANDRQQVSGIGAPSGGFLSSVMQASRVALPQNLMQQQQQPQQQVPTNQQQQQQQQHQHSARTPRIHPGLVPSYNQFAGQPFRMMPSHNLPTFVTAF